MAKKEGKIRILFLASNPLGTNQLDLEKEVREIDKKLEAAQYRDYFELITKWAVRPEDLQHNLLKYKPDIVHFTGHGSKRGEIVLRGPDDKPKLVSKKALVGLFKTLKDNIQVVVLSACYTKKQTEWITEVIDCAVGTRKAISQEAAIAFAASFYEGLAFGRSVKEAFELGVIRLELEGIKEETTPVLCVRQGVDAAKIYLIREKQEPSEAEKSKIPEIFTAKLPVTGRELFGREEKLKILDEVWEDEKTKIISFVAWGGVGKTALVNEWLNRMGEKNWGGAERVYGWSFYSQGTKEDRQASSDTFLAKALEWFGDKETAESKKSAWDKGVRLAELIREQKTLLILDGAEPLQYPPGPMAGRLKDQGLQGLLRELSYGMGGLCIITTREDIKDLEHCVGHTVKRVELENLSPEAGMQVLRETGVSKGTDKELKETSEEFGGHALALTLLGNYLAVVHNGEIRKKDLVPALMEEEEQGGHAKRVMKSYEIWLKGTAELDILYLMGLFDRPAEAGAIKKLREGDAIKGLTENIVSLSEAKWKYAVKHLRELKLLAKEDEGQPDDLDCHPLIREYFGKKLQRRNAFSWREPRRKLWEQLRLLWGCSSRVWREAHGRLYEYYKGVPEREQPDTLEEMEPLFRAVYHGCAAGRHQKALDDVYYTRIQRGGDTNYCCSVLGAFGSDLGAVACFFEKCWDRPAAGLSEDRKALVLNFAGFRLRALGRLREAAEPTEASLELKVEKDWGNAAIAARNLSELYLMLGEVKKAVGYGRRCVEYADKSGEAFERMTERTALADALFQGGEVEEAKGLFEEAEEIQKKDQPRYEYLYSFRGYQYCDLLLALGEYEEVKERAKQTLEWGKAEGYLLDMALDKLSLGRTWLEEVKSEKAKGKSAEKCLTEAKRWLDEAVDGLRKSGEQIWIAKGLLARAELYWYKQGWDEAREDLEEAREIAERGEMKLWMADYHLESARLCLDEGEKGDAKGHREAARRLIRSCGYHKRDEELKDIEGRM